MNFNIFWECLLDRLLKADVWLIQIVRNTDSSRQRGLFNHDDMVSDKWLLIEQFS